MLSSLHKVVRGLRLVDNVRNISISSAKLTANSSSDDDDKRNKAKLKLESLLQDIVNDDSLATPDSDQPLSTPRPQIREKMKKARKQANLGERIVEAAQNVAKHMESEPGKTEAELLHKVIADDEKLQKSVLKAAGQSTLSLLLSELKVEQDKRRKAKSSTALPSIKESTMSRADMMPELRGRKLGFQNIQPVQRVNVDIFGGKPLGIFSSTTKYDEGPTSKTWEECKARDMKITFTQPPRNIWEQMILWTDQGMLWKFPIDNEQGMDEEQEVSFVDHVFLEAHLEDWCPKRGPIRHFMELVCVGLSRNHWLSAQEKKDHLMWYKEYFVSKKKLINELGAGDFVETVQTSS